MKHTDVRVGNIINFFDDESWFKIKNIDSDGLGFEVKNSEEDTWIECTRFYGVKLTVEVLVKLGFNKVEDHYCYPINNDNWNCFALDIGYGGYPYLIVGDNEFTIKYLHQLQNLYFSLTGEELTMEV